MNDIHPEGIFNDVEVTDHGFDRSTKKDSLFFWAKFRTEHGIITGRFFLTGGASDLTVASIRHMGFDGTDFNELGDGSELRGNLCQIKVAHEQYNNRVQANVKWVKKNNSRSGPTHSEEAAQAARELNSMLNKDTPADSEEVPF